jgi:hypothetical protein
VAKAPDRTNDHARLATLETFDDTADEEIHQFDTVFSVNHEGKLIISSTEWMLRSNAGRLAIDHGSLHRCFRTNTGRYHHRDQLDATSLERILDSVTRSAMSRLFSLTTLFREPVCVGTVTSACSRRASKAYIPFFSLPKTSSVTYDGVRLPR